MHRTLELANHLAPELRSKHETSADDPEECMILLDCTFVSLTFWALFGCEDYLDWYLEQDLAPTYRVWRELLALLQAERPLDRFVLKAPVHTGWTQAIVDQVPDAMLVQTHRDPAAVVGSLCSLIETFHGLVCRQIDLHRLGQANLRMVKAFMARNVAERSQHEGRIHDVAYDDLLADPLGVVQRIHERFDLPWGDDERARVQRRIAARPQRKHGTHRYDLARYGLSEDQVRTELQAYTESVPSLAATRPTSRIGSRT